MTYLKLVYFALLFFCITFNGIAQSFKIGGRVTDTETQKPIRNTELFISGTTVGTTTDSLGNYSLKVPHTPCVLVANHVAYNTWQNQINKEGKLNIQLEKSNFSIDEVEVAAKNNRKKNLRFFYRHFLNQEKNKIKILNDSILIFYRDEMLFTAKSKEPLIVVNEFLGYRIKVILEEFKVTAKDGPTGRALPLHSMHGGFIIELTGNYFYESLENENRARSAYYSYNRRTRYHGSYRHFLKSIYENNPGEAGYTIQVFPATEEAAFYEIKNEGKYNDAKEYIVKASKLKVLYHYDQNKFPIPMSQLGERYRYSSRESTIYPTETPFIIRSNGTSPQLSFVIHGLMATRNFAHSLPEDYVPPQRRKKVPANFQE